MTQIPKVHSLSGQLLLRVVLYTVLIAIPLGAINLAFSYQQEKARQQEQLNAMVALTAKQLGAAVWGFNQNAVREILDSLDSFSALQSVQVRTPDMVESYTKPNTVDQTSIDFQVFFLKAPNSNLVLGELWVKLDNAAILSAIQGEMARSMLGLVFRLACLSALIFWLLQRFFTVPVMAIAKHVVDMTPERLEIPAPELSHRHPNELNQLAQGITQLQQTIRNYVGELELANRELQVSQQQNNALIQAIPDLIIAIGRNGDFLAVHGSSAGLIPSDVGPLIGRSLRDVVPSWLAEQYLLVLELAIESQTVQFFEFPYLVNKQNYFFEARVAGLDSETAITIIRDITDKIKAMDDIRQLNAELEKRVDIRTKELQESLNNIEKLHEAILVKEKIASLTPIVTMVSHELNTPIGNVSVLSSALLEQCDTLAEKALYSNFLPEQSKFLNYVREASELILSSSRTAGDLIRSFKKVTVDREGALISAFELHVLAHDIISLIKLTFKYAEVEIFLEIPEGLSLRSYPGPLGQVMDNLVRNALIHGFGPNGSGHVWVKAILLGKEPETVCIDVIDDGKGIPPANRQKVFDPFFTTNMANSSSGLGLSICFNIVHSILGGTLSLEKLPEVDGQAAIGGSWFRIMIPRHLSPVPQAKISV